jgi:hypothetical protein
MRVVIIAGNYEQYIRCCHQKCLNPKEVPFITEPSQIEMLNCAVNPIYFGTFYDNPKYNEIERLMKSKGIRADGRPVEID